MKKHKHILVPKAKVLRRKDQGMRDEFIFGCEKCFVEFVEVPRYESEVPK